MFKRNKPDEMDREIRSKSVITAHYYTQLILVVWIVSDLLRHRSVLMPLYVLLVGFLIRSGAALAYRHDFGDERWKKGLVILLSLIAAVAFLLMLSFGINVTGA